VEVAWQGLVKPDRAVEVDRRLLYKQCTKLVTLSSDTSDTDARSSPPIVVIRGWHEMKDDKRRYAMRSDEDMR
jgi:hypothetical protein